MTQPVPSTPPPSEETPRPQPGRRGFGLFGDFDFGKFVRRVAAAVDFWREENANETHTDIAHVERWCREALERRGRLAGLVAAAKVADAYMRMDEEGRTAFFRLLLERFSHDEQAVLRAVDAYSAGARDGGGDLMALRKALESPRLPLFQQFNTIPQGVKFLIDLRADLLDRLREQPELEHLDYELRGLLENFFNLGFMQLTRITWESPAALLENLVAYEAVNQIRNWRDLKHRLVSDRACFAFLHPAMPNEPVIFVEVALVRGMADNIQEVLDLKGPDLLPDQADTAIFYGISNAQQGLRGIPFGNLLIKQVATRLRGQVPNVKTFATLSPMPRFRKDYLEPALQNGDITAHFKLKEAQHLMQVAGARSVAHAVEELLKQPDWHADEAVAEALRPGLLRAARAYLLEEKRNGRTACPVGHFHGSNGAVLGRVNWLGDTSTNGMKQSAGIMVNYLYNMERFEEQQSAYAQSGTLAAAKVVREL